MKALSFNKGGQNWLIKYKFHLLLFCCIYNYCWLVIAVGNPVKAAGSLLIFPYTVKFFFYVIFQALAVYVNFYILMPRYLEKSRFVAYISLLLFTMLASSLLIITGYYVSAPLSGRSLQSLYGSASDCFYHFFGSALPSTLACMTLTMSIKLTRNWIQTKIRQQLMEKEKLETELKFLKNQFNPHFLFNTINSIFFLIHKNPDKASASLAKFSDLLRYQLYECNDIQIPLSKEITYLENSIELEKLRQSNNVEVSFIVNQPYTEHLCIAPFLLMPFIENAFKHISKHANRPDWIRIKLSVDQQHLDFFVTNSISHVASGEMVQYGGIGLKNVQRRLDLIYPGKYDLNIQRNDFSYEVRLRLHLSELVLAPAKLEMA